MEHEELEKLFKEKFKDFRPEPDERVWKSIEVSLDKKRRRRTVVPIWWRLGGIAALLAILFYIINPFDDASEQIPQTQQQVTDTENIDKKDEDALVKEDSTGISKSNSEPAQLTETFESSKIEDPSNREQNDEPRGLVAKGAEKNRSVDQVQITSNQQDDPSVVKERQYIEETVGNAQKDAIALHNQEVKESGAEKDIDKDQKQPFDKNTGEENAVAHVDEQQDQNEGKSIFEAIEEQNNEEKLVAENEQGKWSVGPAVAPVYFDAIGEGSPIHSNFAPNNKSGNLNLSYGLAVTYQISDRLAVRSGVHRVDYGYDTDDISFSSSPTESTNGEIANINYSQASRSIVVQSNAKEEAPNNSETFDVLAPSAELDGRMVQQMGYVEVPVELSYSLVNRKFGVNLIGGFSSLFLVDNAVSLESQGLITEMGEANNVNNVNFSANAGIGLDYKFSPKIRLSLEPVFKYQLNTFSDTSGNFRPYTIGVYSGVNFRF